MSTLLFIHIPKTAGTSFRLGAESYFGKDKVCYDYTEQAPETSSYVRKCIYENKDKNGFYKIIEKNDIALLCGHVDLDKYIHGMELNNSITFVRDPLQRVLSEYKHFVRLHGYNGKFEEFYKKDDFVNKQSKMLKNIPIQAIGFIGITESYDKDISLINRKYAISIPYMEANMGKERVNDTYDFDEFQLAELKILNSKDIELYEFCLNDHKIRDSLQSRGLPYVHGAITEVNSQYLRGWAWFENSDNEVEIQVLINGSEVACVKAGKPCGELIELNPPRHGYVGFNVDLDKKEGDVVECYVLKTGQRISNQIVFG
ncbi:sulfotransferase family protein [Phytohalomonas tamaricis]|uniref:sulfotransferase family 2 domain-containing protein n=1 Tax=Phytohalomonas tamaricis TaxID=2081032 RepID=UPI000D0B3608|nr:sulfotransferase family 2 domain-containing protein [Phytohalomonas tamaricis]